mmetsp:Transcript_8241/g.16695  ORF Transcript_8241/g.16695 Transcript_8241/m.16695 type:complete len:112 (-) Transcript_8241:1954-2289(-)
MGRIQTAGLPKRTKGNLGKEATTVGVPITVIDLTLSYPCIPGVIQIFKRWFDEHQNHPYPTDQEKHELARQTGTTLQQITNWFINHRKRVWRGTGSTNSRRTGKSVKSKTT